MKKTAAISVIFILAALFILAVSATVDESLFIKKASAVKAESGSYNGAVVKRGVC